MISPRRLRLPRRLAATLSLAALSCGLVVASAAGTAQAATPDEYGYALVLNASGPVAASHWKESVASPAPTASEIDLVQLDRLGASQLQREGADAGLAPAPARTVESTEEHVGSVVVMLRA